ncbi:DUF456 family protein [Domibacillus sp. DTU_2020_1001157_1_SI_ALB_TIR_016]|uniref:DUF456 domain-containing protein n=1 Tax=Domibacillus sp. DTU_2020_1001157_1_SI_ALB_TIR_016 TaxID=3077789 RepID=UPI0028E20850|nr:DUF456 family protein [Domibacillus sp. DTU_2020_1001157_1_SI_ALB_TIR_016]WNS79944.1 DUF456 family protein [Domibacillus sp. DTU_2020_1001157_1_SI_ALB_TIR_016]
MSIFVWAVIILLFIASFAGFIFPIVPSVLVLWAGFGLYYVGISREELSILFWIGMLVLTALMFLADFLANSYFVKKYGGSKWGEWTAVIALIAGSFIIPPFGILIVPFVAVFAVELIVLKNIKQAFFVAYATLIAFLSGTLAKVVIQLIMIGWFLAEAIL